MMQTIAVLVFATGTQLIAGVPEEKMADKLTQSLLAQSLKVYALPGSTPSHRLGGGTSKAFPVPYRPAPRLLQPSISPPTPPVSPIHSPLRRKEELLRSNEVAEILKADIHNLLNADHPNWNIFTENFTVIDRMGARVSGLGPIPLDFQMLKFLRMVRRLGPLPIDIQLHFRKGIHHESFDSFLVALWKVELGGSDFPFPAVLRKFLPEHHVVIEAETSFHIRHNKIDYMRLDDCVVNGKSLQRQERFSGVPTAVFVVQTEEEVEIDIYRDTILRYAGFLNEMGEAFRPIVPGNVVVLSYVLTITYVLADALSKGGQTSNLPMNKGISGCGIAAVIDTLAFQLTASVILPGAIINRWVALDKYLVDDFFKVSDTLAQTLSVKPDETIASIGSISVTCCNIAEKIPTVLGLALIPFIVAPLDNFVEKLLDDYFRPKLQEAFPKCDLPMCNREECTFD